LDLLYEDFIKLLIGDFKKDVAMVHKKCRIYQENLLQSKNSTELLHRPLENG
jgi:hypothetical protein